MGALERPPYQVENTHSLGRMADNRVTSGEEVQRQSRSEGDAHEEAINIAELAAFIRENRKNQPKQLKSTAGGSKCCIFRIPQSLKEINPQAYKPYIISIGPYHHGREELSMMEEHKWRYLDGLLVRSEDGNGFVVEDYLKAMAQLEVSARQCYSEEITKMNSEQFVKMLLLDGCFLVELLRVFEEEVEMMKDDPIFYIPWVIHFLMRDLLRLENQLPFFVLQCLFDLSNAPNGKHKSTLPVLAIKFFSWAIERPDDVLQWSIGKNYDHLLDLFRATFIPPSIKEPEEDCKSAKTFHCVSKLVRAGIEFKPMDRAKSFLEISFKKGQLQIPHLLFDDFLSSFFQNCVAYEQAHQHCGAYFTTYATFMDCLIDTDKDVALLGDKKIIENCYGTDDDVAKLFNELGRGVLFDVESCYLAEQFDEVKHYRNSWRFRWVEFKNTYFNTPWSFISALAALILLFLALTQTAFAIYPYYRPRS